MLRAQEWRAENAMNEASASVSGGGAPNWRALAAGGDVAFPVAASLVLAAILAVALTSGQALEVWRSGAFFDSDDALRATQTRDLLSGQAWFDMTATRIDPQRGVFMHWSRVVDAPLAAMEGLLRFVTSAETAERITRLVFPAALLFWLLALAGRAATIFSDGARHAAIWLTLLSGPMFVQFAPGRIDHHAPQIVCLMGAAIFMLRGFDPARAREMALGAALMALSMAISLENLPFFAVLIAAVAWLYVLDGETMRACLGWFGAGLIVAFPLLYAATVGPDRYALSACDALSFVHLAAIAAGGCGFLALAGLSPHLRSRGLRAGAAGAIGLGVAILVWKVAPQCVGDPLGATDSLVREIWMSRVVESLPLIASLFKAPAFVATLAAPPLLGLALALKLGFAAQGVTRRRLFALAAMIAIGVALGLFWQVRIFTSVTPLAMVALAVGLEGVAGRAPQRWRLGLFTALCFLCSSLGLSVLLPAQSEAAPHADASCLGSDSFLRLAALPKGLVAGPIDFGSHIVALTPHAALAAPYHRNNHGNRLAIDTFLSPPERAESLLRGAGAKYVLWCAGGQIASTYASRSPASLAAALSRGETPSYLAPIDNGASKLAIYALRP